MLIPIDPLLAFLLFVMTPTIILAIPLWRRRQAEHAPAKLDLGAPRSKDLSRIQDPNPWA